MSAAVNHSRVLGEVPCPITRAVADRIITDAPLHARGNTAVELVRLADSLEEIRNIVGAYDAARKETAS